LLAAFAAGAELDRLPADVVETVRVATLNILAAASAAPGHASAGSTWSWRRRSAEAWTKRRSWATAPGVSVPAAAYANASLGFGLDYEDMIPYIAHPGHATVASGLAVGERQRVSGRDFLAAVAAGSEVCARIALAVQPTPERGAEVWGEQYHTFAAAATAGRLLELDPDQMEIAFGVADTYTTVPSAYKYFGPVAETRPMREVKLGWGRNCMAGVVAALSAKRGFAGGYGVFDGRHGFWIMHGSDRCDFEGMVAGLAESCPAEVRGPLGRHPRRNPARRGARRRRPARNRRRDQRAGRSPPLIRSTSDPVRMKNVHPRRVSAPGENRTCARGLGRRLLGWCEAAWLSGIWGGE
jgi:2-methylcitrate dehydratase MmgE/PrpD-like protein